jgi:poly(hydroxyalkanoate) depolymerase family esterase
MLMSDFAAAMRRALDAVRAYNVTDATRIIQKALAGRGAPAPAAAGAGGANGAPAASMRRRGPGGLMDPKAEVVDAVTEPPPMPGRRTASRRTAEARPMPRPRRPLGEVLKALRKSRVPQLDPAPARRPSEPPALPEGARFLTRAYSGPTGRRPYKLYIPASATEAPRGLILMLHGCKQNPDDFAAGTGMNALAEAHRLWIAYPAQVRLANASRCWNWFAPAHQLRDGGEPAILAGITREIMAEAGLERDRVFVAGLSAGGAMAAVMAATYPDLFAAAGIHSGLAYGVATDVVSAFAAMRGEPGADAAQDGAATEPGGVPPMPQGMRTIIFHGAADATVHPTNAERIVDAASPAAARGRPQRQSGVAQGRPFTRTILRGPDGDAAVECWLIAGAGHAWSGGSEAGSYADPQGPDASAEMVRFFLEGQERGKRRGKVRR